LEFKDHIDPDWDGEGYWDGWVAVYDVGRSDNVVLYMENIRNDGGIDESEIVQNQAGIHDVDEVASAGGADIDDDGTKEHSNLHIGEMVWETDPQDDNGVPNPQVSVETHFWAGEVNQSLNNSGFANGIEENYALYGIDVEIIRDETIDPEDEFAVGGPRVNSLEYMLLANRHHDEENQFLLIAPKPGKEFPPYDDNPLGGANPAGDHIGLYYDPIATISDREASRSDVRNTPYENEPSVVAGFVLMHELGHVLNLGRADDYIPPEPVGEVYSGDNTKDKSLEIIKNNGEARQDLSIMALGWEPHRQVETDGVGYYIISLEEASTVEEDSS